MDTIACDQEVEIRAILSLQQQEKIYKHLKKNASYQGKVDITDHYFCKKEVDSFSQVAMKDVGSYSLRLRSTTQDHLTTHQLNTKIITQYNDHNAWKEHETTVTSFKQTHAILHTIGYKVFFTLEKRRETFIQGHVNFHLEAIKDFKPILEIEILTTQASSQKSKKEILSHLQKLGVTQEQIVPKSITHLLMEQKVNF
ncbi:MAG: CYTH domain-containing protein [Bacteroidota bacterium]